jgi:Family of unknown function (DUF6879)
MGTLVTEDGFADLFRTFKQSAWRWEGRAHYAMDYEAADFERFLAGTPAAPPEVSWWRPWLDNMQSLTRQGKSIGRVRVLAEPPSDYQRWEIWATPWHAAAGEAIAYMSRSRAQGLGLPLDDDWWLFDDERLLLMRFDVSGRIAGKVLVTDQDIVVRHCAWRDVAVRNATSAEETAAV